MTHRLHPSQETSDFTLDASSTMEEQVLGLIEANIDHAQADRVRQLVHERFEELRAHGLGLGLGVEADVAAGVAATGEPYAEPGTVAYRLNLIQSRIDRREDATRKAGVVISHLLDDVDRLERRSDALEARLLAFETKHG